MEINFQFGKKKTSMATWVKLTLAIKMGVPFIAKVIRVKESSLYAFLDEIVRKYFPQSVVNEFIVKDDELLSSRVDRDVTRAIDDYNSNQTTPIIQEPNVVELEPDGSDAQKLLGGEIRLANTFTETNGNSTSKEVH